MTVDLSVWNAMQIVGGVFGLVFLVAVGRGECMDASLQHNAREHHDGAMEAWPSAVA